MKSARTQIRKLVADRLAFWALRLNILACRLDSDRRIPVDPRLVFMDLRRYRP